MPLQLRDMRWVLTVSRSRSLRQAAQVLNVQESSLSRRLKDLEYRLGVELFERSANGTSLTAAGEAFIPAAQRIVAEMEAAFTRMKARGRGESGDLIVGICVAFPALNLREILAEYRRQHDGIEVHSIDGSRSRLFADLASGNIDVFFAAGMYSTWSDGSKSLWSEHLVVALPADHILCSSSFIRWRDLVGARILVNRRDPGPEYEAMLRARLGDRSGCTFISHEVCPDRLLGLVAAGLGLTLVSEGAARLNVSGVEYRELNDDDGPLSLGIAVYWKETNRNPALRSFLKLLRKRYSDTDSVLASD